MEEENGMVDGNDAAVEGWVDGGTDLLKEVCSRCCCCCWGLARKERSELCRMVAGLKKKHG